MAEMSLSPKHSPGKKRKTKTKWRTLNQTEYPASSGTGPSQKSDTDPAVNPVKPPTQAAAAASLTRSAWGSGHVPSTILANSSSIQQNSGNSESWPSLGGAPPMNKVQAGGAAPTAAQAEPTQPAVVLSDNEENMSHDENGTQDENMPEITTCTGGTSDEVTPDGSESGISRKVGRRQPDYGSEEDNSPPRPAFRSQFSSSLPAGSLFKLSRTLTYILRHGAGDLGLEFLQGGFLYIDDLLELQQLRNYTLNNIIEVVETNDKKRFHIDRDKENKLMIRANQGHSVEVEGLELTEITDASRFPDVIHGTYLKHWESIKSEGLSRMSRTHIHFAPGEPGKDKVISGMRKTCDVIIFLDLASAMKSGLQFFLSANRVMLTPGDENGIIPTKYFEKVINRKTRAALPW